MNPDYGKLSFGSSRLSSKEFSSQCRCDWPNETRLTYTASAVTCKLFIGFKKQLMIAKVYLHLSLREGGSRFWLECVLYWALCCIIRCILAGFEKKRLIFSNSARAFWYRGGIVWS